MIQPRGRDFLLQNSHISPGNKLSDGLQSHSRAPARKQFHFIETLERGLVDAALIAHYAIVRIPLNELLGLKVVKPSSDSPALRITRRFRDMDKLPEDKKRAVLKVFDELIRANS